MTRPIRVSTSKPATNASRTAAPGRRRHSAIASAAGATGAEPWTMEARCVSSKSSAWPWAPLASAASSALVRRPRPITVACGSPPVAAITASSAAASGSVEPRMATPSQSVRQSPAASVTAAGSDRSSSPSTKSTSASATRRASVDHGTITCSVVMMIGSSPGAMKFGSSARTRAYWAVAAEARMACVSSNHVMARPS